MPCQRLDSTRLDSPPLDQNIRTSNNGAMVQSSTSRRVNPDSLRLQSPARPPASGQHRSSGQLAGSPTKMASSRTGNQSYPRPARPSSRQSVSSSQHRRRPSSEKRYSKPYHVRQTPHGQSGVDNSSDVGSEASSGGYRRPHPERISSNNHSNHRSEERTSVGSTRNARKLSIRSNYSGEDSPVNKRFSIQSDMSQNSKAAKKVIDGEHTISSQNCGEK
jgi:hypothetical protein